MATKAKVKAGPESIDMPYIALKSTRRWSLPMNYMQGKCKMILENGKTPAWYEMQERLRGSSSL